MKTFWCSIVSRNHKREKFWSTTLLTYKNFWIATVSQNHKRKKFWSTTLSTYKNFWIVTVSQNHKRGKFHEISERKQSVGESANNHDPSHTRVPLPHTNSEKWKMNICRVGVLRSSRFYLPSAFFVFCFVGFSVGRVGEVVYTEGKFLVPFKFWKGKFLVPWERGFFNTGSGSRAQFYLFFCGIHHNGNVGAGSGFDCS